MFWPLGVDSNHCRTDTVRCRPLYQLSYLGIFGGPPQNRTALSPVKSRDFASKVCNPNYGAMACAALMIARISLSETTVHLALISSIRRFGMS